jgi:hypothetical protein
MLYIKDLSFGKGVFTKELIPQNYPVLEFKGDIVSLDQVSNLDLYLPLDKNKFLSPSGLIDDFVNHSCSPNCYVKIIHNRAFLYSIHPIMTNTQITFDYSAITIVNNEFQCQCNSFNCRKVIGSYKTIPQNILNHYLKNKYIPKFIIKELENA